MAKQRYCATCQQWVKPWQQIDVGTLMLVWITLAAWLAVVARFYRKRCPICNGAVLRGNYVVMYAESPDPQTPQLPAEVRGSIALLAAIAVGLVIAAALLSLHVHDPRN